MIERIDAHREDRADRFIDVERHALHVIGKAADRFQIVEVVVSRLFRDDVDRAAGGSAAREARSGPAQNFHLLGIEVLADADAGIANAVDENVVANVEAAYEKAIAEGVAAFASAQRHARHAPTDFAQGEGVLVVEHFLGEHRDRARRIEHRFGEFRGRQPVDFIGRDRISIRIGVRRRRKDRQTAVPRALAAAA